MAEFVKVGEVGEVSPGKFVLVRVRGISAVLVNLNGAYYAVNSSCTHEGGALDEGDLEGLCLTCPDHGSQFDVRTGEVLEGPATEPVATYPVRVQGREIQVSVG